MQAILCNLKVLDWVITEDALRTDVQQQSFVGESDVIQWVWNRWLGSGSDRHARAALLIKVAEEEGQRLGSPSTIGSLRDDEKRTLGELEKDRLVRVHKGNIRFTHDLLGDWGRFQALLSADQDGIPKIRAVVTYPRWQRAVRLSGQRRHWGEARAGCCERARGTRGGAIRSSPESSA
jgi:hypothetical protein